MKDLEHVFVRDEQVEQGFEVDIRLGVDRGGFLNARDLDQAQVGPIGVLAHELGVHGDERLAGEPLDQGLKVVRAGD